MRLSNLQNIFQKFESNCVHFFHNVKKERDLLRQVPGWRVNYLMFAWVLMVMAVVGMAVMSLETTMVPSRMPVRIAL